MLSKNSADTSNEQTGRDMKGNLDNVTSQDVWTQHRKRIKRRRHSLVLFRCRKMNCVETNLKIETEIFVHYNVELRYLTPKIDFTVGVRTTCQGISVVQKMGQIS